MSCPVPSLLPVLAGTCFRSPSEKHQVAPKTTDTSAQSCLSSAPFLPAPYLSHNISNRHRTLERLVGTLNVSWSRQPQSSESPNPKAGRAQGEDKPQPEDPFPPPWLAPGLSAKEMTAEVIRAGVLARPGKRQWGG